MKTIFPFALAGAYFVALIFSLVGCEYFCNYIVLFKMPLTIAATTANTDTLRLNRDTLWLTTDCSDRLEEEGSHDRYQIPKISADLRLVDIGHTGSKQVTDDFDCVSRVGQATKVTPIFNGITYPQSINVEHHYRGSVYNLKIGLVPRKAGMYKLVSHLRTAKSVYVRADAHCEDEALVSYTINNGSTDANHFKFLAQSPDTLVQKTTASNFTYESGYCFIVGN